MALRHRWQARPDISIDNPDLMVIRSRLWMTHPETYEAMMRNPTSQAFRPQDHDHEGKPFEEDDEGDFRSILISKQSQGWIWNTGMP